MGLVVDRMVGAMVREIIEGVLMAGGVEHDPPVVRLLTVELIGQARASLVVAILGRARSATEMTFARQCALAAALVHATKGARA